MHDSGPAETGDSSAAALHTALDELLARPLSSNTGEEVIALWRDVERFRNQLAVLEHALIAEIQTRHLDTERGAANTKAFARDVLGIGIHEAGARVRAADAAGPRVTLTGEPLAPIYECVAAAQADGTINPAQAALIVKTIDRLPGEAQEEWVEPFLVAKAQQFDTDTLAKLTEALRARLDPDGTEPRIENQRRRRDFTLHSRADGTSRLTGELTAELSEHLQSFFDSYAAPVPEAHGVKDPRTAGQRRHDALLTGLQMLLRTGDMPASGGITATVLLVSDLKDWVQGTGTVSTGHGGIIPTTEARRWTDAQTRYLHLLLDDLNRPVDLFTSPRRLFSEAQRLAMAVRDRGCSFPGCDVPAQRCQAHHIQDHHDGGPTSLTNGTLLCGYHHRNFAKFGWQCRMTDGRPEWIPPPWLARHAA
jgi:hypothetical protein